MVVKIDPEGTLERPAVKQEASAHQSRRQILLIVILTAVAFALRIYRLNMPVWFDELWGYMLGRRGLEAILRNSLSDPTPPLWYLIQWAATGFGLWYSELSMRWPSFLVSGLAVILTYLVARSEADDISAFIAAMLLAFSPFFMYYSQEARPYALVTCLTVASIYLMGSVINHPYSWARWIFYGLVILSGMYLTYPFVAVAGIQIIYLLFFAKLYRQTLIYAAILLVLCLPWIYLLVRVIPVAPNMVAGLKI